MKPIVWIGAFLWLLLMGGCHDSSHDITNTPSEAQRLPEQFGELQPYFTEEGMQRSLSTT